LLLLPPAILFAGFGIKFFTKLLLSPCPYPFLLLAFPLFEFVERVAILGGGGT